MIITNKNYIVPIILNSTDLLNGIIQAKTLSYELRDNLKKIWTKQGTITQLNSQPLDNWIDKIIIDFEHLEGKAMEYIDAKFPQQKRKKRAYINIIGDLSKTLFGTATEADIEEIHENLDKIQEMSEDQRRQINVHTTILNNTIRDVTRIDKAIQSLTTTNNLLKM